VPSFDVTVSQPVTHRVDAENAYQAAALVVIAHGGTVLEVNVARGRQPAPLRRKATVTKKTVKKAASPTKATKRSPWSAERKKAQSLAMKKRWAAGTMGAKKATKKKAVQKKATKKR
jgi:hypothetical protein